MTEIQFTRPTATAAPSATALVLEPAGGQHARALESLGFRVTTEVSPDFTDVAFSRVQVVVSGRAGSPDRDAEVDARFARAVRQILPRFFVHENVRGLASPRNAARLEGRLTDLRFMGYHVEARTLDAADSGSDVRCRRLFIAGVRDDVREERVRNVYDWRGTHAPIWWPSRRYATPFTAEVEGAYPWQALRELLMPNVR